MKKLPVILIIAGILIVLIPVVGQLYTQYKENKMISEWLENSADEADAAYEAVTNPEEAYAQLEESFAAENAGQTADAEGIQPTGTGDGLQGSAGVGEAGGSQNTTPKAQAKPAVKQNVLGVIVIDKIKVKLPVVEGVTEANLRAGVGHIPGTAALGQPGNSALAGHRNYTFGRYFNRLDELELDDKIVISTKAGDYKYIVYEKIVVAPDDVSVLEGSKDDNIITLITCTPIYIATHRLIVKARLYSSTAADP